MHESTDGVTYTGGPLRELPWRDSGKRVFLATGGGQHSMISALADSVESGLLESAGEVARLSRSLLDAETRLTTDELCFTVRRLIESAEDTVHVATLRGARLGVPG